MMWGEDFDLEFDFEDDFQENDEIQRAQEVFGEDLMDASEWWMQGNGSNISQMVVENVTNETAYAFANLVHASGVAGWMEAIWNDTEA